MNLFLNFLDNPEIIYAPKCILVDLTNKYTNVTSILLISIIEITIDLFLFYYLNKFFSRYTN